jgi:hypothetical protein
VKDVDTGFALAGSDLVHGVKLGGPSSTGLWEVSKRLREEHVFEGQCSEILTLRYEKLHLAET